MLAGLVSSACSGRGSCCSGLDEPAPGPARRVGPAGARWPSPSGRRPRPLAPPRRPSRRHRQPPRRRCCAFWFCAT